MIIKYIIAILLFSAIILFHELGHFLLAKANGIRVNEFSLGLGPTIVGFTKGETKYSIKLLPFGGVFLSVPSCVLFLVLSAGSLFLLWMLQGKAASRQKG